MSAFSECLKKAVARANLSVVKLAALSGVERSFIQKMLSDNRVPSDEKIVSMLARGLALSGREEQEMLQAYHMTRLGAEVYYQREDIKKLLQSIEEGVQQGDFPIIHEGKLEMELPKTINIVRGKAQVLEAVRVILAQEAGKEEDIGIVMQPEHDEILGFLQKLARKKASGQIHHLICLDNTGYKWDYHNPNLLYLKNLLPFLYYHDNYEFYYYYDALASHINEQSVLPYYIVTSDCLCAFSYDFEEALLTSDEDMRQFYMRQFERQIKMSRPLLESMDVMENYMAAYIENEKILHGNGEVFNMEGIPCLVPYISPEMLENCIITEAISIEEARNLLETDQRCLETLRQQRGCTFFFSEEGAKQFMEEGRIGTVPGSIYRPLNPEDRYCLMERLIQELEEDQASGYMVRADRLCALRQIHIEITDRGQVLFFISTVENKSKCIMLNEKNTSSAFYDFMEYLKTSEYVYGKKEMLESLKRIMKKWKR